eukprot:TRINITY_DN3515_c0_g1_i2.p1 TRINITY_DN3515_c0_g1~~TRINITY_DN3515_c0_g1_i2.p1  ORF type:complete len:157 (-),score=42.94 TRINITY_DN3515_c0_g1_i2:9-419(-)
MSEEGILSYLLDWKLLIVSTIALVIVVIIGRLGKAAPQPDIKEIKRREEEQAKSKKREIKSYTLAEINKHNTSTDCWLIVDNKVYDVTSYVDEHPGGDAIFNNAGADSTKGFKGDQHPLRVADMIEEYYIGTVAAE